MTINKNIDYLVSLFSELCRQSGETEWIEFKRNNDNPEQIGEYLSALANSAALVGKAKAYMLWGVDNNTHVVVGTQFSPLCSKVGNENLENWLLRLLKPKIDFHFYELVIDELSVVLLEIEAAFRHPVQFKNQEFIRIGSYKNKLKDHPEKERELWRVFDQTPFESGIATDNIPADSVLQLLEYPAYFDLLKLPLPETRDAILATLQSDKMITENASGKWDVTNLGALLFARKLADFRGLSRKAIRVIVYNGESRVETVREQEGGNGYAYQFKEVIRFVLNLLPSNEVIGQALRKEVPMFPEPAIRELVANALIHQDFQQTGTGPMIEIFSNRMEVTNPGVPLVETKRFLDSPPKSRNEALASFMRRIGVCEERGSGVDKVVFQTEFYQLPAPVFEQTGDHTRCILFAHREFKDMDKQDRIRAAYLHACLRYVKWDYMTNSTLRERFGIQGRNSATASRIIKDAMDTGEICPFDEDASRRYKKYVPWWAK